MLNDFGKIVRKGRIDAGVTLLEMSESLGTTPAFLSGMETGRKKVPVAWVAKIEEYFAAKGVVVEDLRAAADVANKSVSLDGLSREHQMLVAGFARVQSSSISEQDINALKDLFAKFQGTKK